MANKLVKYFKKSLMLEKNVIPVATPSPDGMPDDFSGDEAALEASFENPADSQALNGEIQDATMDPTAKAGMISLADSYADKVTNKIIPMLDKLHKEVVSGSISQAKIDLKGLTDIKAKLAALAQQLRGQALDNLNKTEKTQQ